MSLADSSRPPWAYFQDEYIYIRLGAELFSLSTVLMSGEGGRHQADHARPSPWWRVNAQHKTKENDHDRQSDDRRPATLLGPLEY